VVFPQGHTINIMKETLTSLLRHALTALAGVGTFMAGRGLIAPEDAQAVDASGATVADALVVVVVAVLMRLIIKFSGNLFRHDKDGQNNGGSTMLLLLGMTVLLGLASSSCSPSQLEAAQSVPVRASYQDNDGNVYAYDPATGVSVRIIESAK
jgi:hypothetical protein